MTLNIVIVATNAYALLGLRLIVQFRQHYRGARQVQFHWYGDRNPLDFINCDYVTVNHRSHRDWPAACYDKLRIVAEVGERESGHVLYLDADTAIRKPFDDTWMPAVPIMAAEHWINHSTYAKNHERTAWSQCYIPREFDPTYFYGAYFGGECGAVAGMCRLLVDRIAIDHAKRWDAVNHDESYLNWYWWQHPPDAIVPSKDFPFVLSDKGGLAIERNPRFSIEENLSVLRSARPALFDVVDGAVVLQ